jgi:hypothetical protein
VVMNTMFTATGNTISGFGANDQIDLGYVNFSNTTDLVWTENSSNTGGILTVDDHNGNVANIALLGQYSASSFVLASDGHGGTLVTDPPSQHLSLFAAQT